MAFQQNTSDIVTGKQQQQQQHRSEEHTSELQSPAKISYAVFCLKKKKKQYAGDRALRTSEDDDR